MQLVLVMAWLQNCRWPWQSKQSLLSQPLLSSSTGALSSKSWPQQQADVGEGR
jgi:hypothetical protein